MIGPGSVVAQAYRVERKVGRGAMGTVFEATVIATGERVALKIPHECFLADRSALKRFMREATATLTIRSPFVIRTMAVGKLPTGMPFLAMEFVDGPSLAELMDRFAGAPMPLPLAMRLLLQLAEGLSTAHEAGVIHRDLKPGNVLVASPGGGAVARIFDFGLSVLAFDEAGRLTLSGTTFGTPQYMAPEQTRAAKHAGVQPDVYALGVVLYQLETEGNFYRAEKLPLYHGGDNLVLGDGKLLGSLEVTEEFDTVPEAEEVFTLPSSFHNIFIEED